MSPVKLPLESGMMVGASEDTGGEDHSEDRRADPPAPPVVVATEAAADVFDDAAIKDIFGEALLQKQLSGKRQKTSRNLQHRQLVSIKLHKA
eukprot:CAMPEP_0194505458 /NCGR_PEP_ID=MMETSP0253-20130528/32064_1 /TAXON_ID=2966 /ORGANISM="Noctiluca scintillans" /LENGTH=91 /DNA_ID=CAMNT_0039348013 /DNA_START=1 /DNA_END=273 /DNA_ORIENTATION=+